MEVSAVSLDGSGDVGVSCESEVDNLVLLVCNDEPVVAVLVEELELVDMEVKSSVLKNSTN